MNLEAIDTIIFDLGGVIININPQLTITAFSKEKSLLTEPFKNQLLNHPLIISYETGTVSTSVFVQEIKKWFPELSISIIIDYWNKLLLDIPKRRIELIQKLNKKYHLLLLSNTNELHLAYINEYLNKEFNIKKLDYLFNATYYSFLLNDRKPNLAIFEKVLHQSKVTPKKTLFIDDTLIHTQSAQQLGIQTYHLNTQQQDITDLFNVN